MVEMVRQPASIQGKLNCSAWYGALHLEERLRLLRAQGHIDPEQIAPHSEDADRSLKRWQAHPAFAQEMNFADRLKIEGIREEELYALLGESLEQIEKRVTTPPDWMNALMQAFQTPTDEFQLPEISHQQAPDQFLCTLKPLLKQGFERLRQGIEALAHQHQHVPFDQKTIIHLLYSNIALLLFARCNRVIVLELHIAKLQEQLHGDTPEERFQNFLQHLQQPEACLQLLEEYPVLARQLVTMLDHWIMYSLEFLQHLCADWTEIRRTFFADSDPGPLLSLEGGAGDLHKGGRSVMLLTFQEGLRLVYKPKSLAIDAHFQGLLTWLNARSTLPSFRTLALLDRGAYGWSEFVAVQGCTTEEEVERFYQRQGGYLALLYILDATDFHFENLIACGEHPLLIDLESLFHPHIRTLDAGIYGQIGPRTIEQSVLRPALLPQRILSSKDAPGVDISGIGGHGGQTVPRPILTWDGLGTDQMRLIQQRVTLPGKQNRPTLNGLETEIGEHLVMEGFTAIYRLLMQQRQEFIAGPLACFAHDEIRCILRSTRVYQKLLDASFHPTMLRDALARERVFEYLWLNNDPHLLRIITAERSDLYRGDVPFFTTRPDCHHLYTSQGICIANALTETSMEGVTRRIQQLDAQDLSRQLWFIRASLATMQTGHEQSAQKHIHLVSSRGKASKQRLIKMASALGERLSELACVSEYEVSWMGLTMHGDREWVIEPTSTSLYSGTPGIAFFLAYLGIRTRQPRYTDLARKALMTVRQQVEHLKKQPGTSGAFDGWGSIIYLYTHLGILWKEPALLAEATELASSFAAGIEQDDALDMIGGSAGCLMSLVGLYKVTRLPQILALAQRCGERLVARATPTPGGVGWILPHLDECPLAGFAHGAAGIAFSLLTLAHLTGQEHFRQTALAAINYERSIFSPQELNWPDFRRLNVPADSPISGDVRYMTAWCHGAAGIGLARLASLKYLDDEAIRTEIRIALQTTLAQGFGRDHSLCHGDLGNLETLLVASQLLADSSYSEAVEQLTAMLLTSIETAGWRTAAPQGVETPGLMTGIAGTGYALLRLAMPTRVPSLLLLEPPPQARDRTGMR